MVALIETMSLEEIKQEIEKYLPIQQSKKDQNGEVFTPVSLIEELLDNLPPSVWKTPDLKWLDPSSGIGNFMMIVYYRLLKNLTPLFNGSVEKTSKHILKNMLYMVEIDKENVEVARKIFGTTANILHADFLQEPPSQKYNVIIGNPPYNAPSVKTGTNAGRDILWDKFIEKSLQIVADDKSYIGFIVPSLWRQPENKLYPLMTRENHIRYLHIYGKKQGLELFGVGTRFDIFVLDCKRPTAGMLTTVIDELGKRVDIDLSKWDFLPNYDFPKIKRIMSEDGINILYSRVYHSTKLSAKKTAKYKYPVVHTMTKKGLGIQYAEEKVERGGIGIPKVLLNKNEVQYPVNDYTGKYGMSELTFGIPITSKRQGDEIVKAINSDEFKEIIKATKWATFQTDYRMFQYFAKDFYKRILENKRITNKRYTTGRKERINKTVKKHYPNRSRISL